MKNYRSKQQSTARAIKRRHKLLIRDAKSNTGFKVVSVPKKNKSDFMAQHRNRMFKPAEKEQTTQQQQTEE